MIHQALSNFFATLQVDCSTMDVNILKQTSHEFKDINIVQNVGDALSEGPALTNLRQAFQQYFTLLKQYPMSVTTLSQYYEMVLMVLVQCDLNHKYIQMIQQLNSEDQLYLKELIEDLFTKLSTPSTNASNTQDIQYELTQLQFNYSKLLKENEELRQKQSQQTPASNKNTLHNDLSLAEDKINEMDVMIQKQSSIINDLTNKLQHQANLQHTNTTLKQEIEELKHKLIKFKKMESTNLVLNKKLDNLHDLEAHVKHLEQVNHELMNQLKGEPQKQQHDSLLNQEKRQLEIHQIQLQEELSATLDQLALLEQEKMAQLDYIHQLEEKISDLEKSATESPPSSAELLRQVNPSYSDQEKEQLIKENKDLQHQLLVFQAKSSNDNDPHDVLFETKLKEYVTQIQQLRHEKDSLNVLCDELKSNKSEISEKLENTTAQFKIKYFTSFNVEWRNMKRINECMWSQ